MKDHLSKLGSLVSSHLCCCSNVPPLDQHRRPGLTVRLLIWRSLKTNTLGLRAAQKTWHGQEDSQKCSFGSCSNLWTSNPSWKVFTAPLFLQFHVVLQCVWCSPSDTPILSQEVAPLWGFFSLVLKGFPHSSSGPTSPDNTDNSGHPQTLGTFVTNNL